MSPVGPPPYRRRLLREAFMLRLKRGRGVAASYTLGPPVRGAGLLRTSVAGGRAPYTVTLDLAGRGRHRCSCPDFTREPARAWTQAGGFCKHIIGAALKLGCGALLLAPILSRVSGQGARRPGGR